MFFHLLMAVEPGLLECAKQPFHSPTPPSIPLHVYHSLSDKRLSVSALPKKQTLIPQNTPTRYVYSVIGRRLNQASSYLKHDIEAPLLPIDPAALPRRRQRDGSGSGVHYGANRIERFIRQTPGNRPGPHPQTPRLLRSLASLRRLHQNHAVQQGGQDEPVVHHLAGKPQDHERLHHLGQHAQGHRPQTKRRAARQELQR